jgi:hypothetical protein
MSLPKRVPAVLVVAAIFLTACGQAAAQTQTTVSLEQAVRQGLVKVDVSAFGGAYGDAMQVTVQRAVQYEVRVVVEPGTVFVSVGGDVQNMVGSVVKGEMLDQNTYQPGEVMVLVDGARRSFLVEAFCLDYGKPAPRAADGFRLAARDPRAARILVSTPRAKVTIEAIQSALWMDRAGVSAEVLQRQYGFGEQHIAVAQSLLQRAREVAMATVPPGAPPEVRVEIDRLLSPDPAARRQAAMNLGAMRERAILAMPFLTESSLAVRPLGPPAAAPAPAPAPAPVPRPAPAPAPGGQTPAKPEVRAPAAPGPVVPLPQAAQAAQVQVDVAISQALEAIAKSRPIEPLLDSLKSTRPLLRRHAARTLGAMGDKRAVEPLIAALGDKDERFQEVVAQSLHQITGQDLGRDKAKWEDWWKANKDGFTPKE